MSLFGGGTESKLVLVQGEDGDGSFLFCPTVVSLAEGVLSEDPESVYELVTN
ncbi:MAG: hypothetical protein JJ963_09405 [Balneolaceae bacterium]|nr:hypothetical protein [Balneolaceae bacterium]